MKGQFPTLRDKILTVNPSSLAVSAVTLFEMEYGAAKANWSRRRRNDMYLFLSTFSPIPFTEKDAVAAGQLRAVLSKLGTSIGVYDLLIAAQGLVRGFVVVTHNISEFRRVPGLNVEDWVEEL